MKHMKSLPFTGIAGTALAILLSSPAGFAAEESAPPAGENVGEIVEEAQRMAGEIVERVRSWKSEREQPSAYIGVVIESVPDVLRDYIDLPKGVGLLLSRISKDGPAMKAGLKDNDILVSFAGQKVINYNQLSTLIDLEGAGSTVPVKVIRKGEELEFDLVLEERPKIQQGFNFAFPPAPPAPPPPGGVGSNLDHFKEWIPGSVQVYVDDKEQVHVDLRDLKSDLQDLRVRLLELKRSGQGGPVVTEHGDMGARTSVVHVEDRNINFKNKDGKLLITSSEAGQQAMVWDADGELIYQGELPEDYPSTLPEEAVRLIDAYRSIQDQLEVQSGEELEIQMHNEAVQPMTMVVH